MAREYILQGFFPDKTEWRCEVTVNFPSDAMLLAEGAQKLGSLEAVWVIDARSGDKIAYYSDNLVIL